jgi:hypothetical protein
MELPEIGLTNPGQLLEPLVASRRESSLRRCG